MLTITVVRLVLALARFTLLPQPSFPGSDHPGSWADVRLPASGSGSVLDVIGENVHAQLNLVVRTEDS
ncbi:hypothetical protein BN2475_190036 [Paraburkholderia ribeironis]|uniref:Uncharacterized protein n=1 Tax=Paraburkholderia ribeironis TaxID=1247936 RepID=A0A1N7RVB5_9BURK|nr:hypothetical protein BN2475_190036 [Paraburkholderia ribeironis]